ncbi:hypothetical protein ABH912_000490 [Pseudomonas sp. BT76 TE3572]
MPLNEPANGRIWQVYHYPIREIGFLGIEHARSDADTNLLARRILGTKFL